MSQGFHLIRYSTVPVAVTRLATDCPLKLIDPFGPLAIVPVCSKRCWRPSIIPPSKKSNIRAGRWEEFRLVTMAIKYYNFYGFESVNLECVWNSPEKGWRRYLSFFPLTRNFFGTGGSDVRRIVESLLFSLLLMWTLTCFCNAICKIQRYKCDENAYKHIVYCVVFVFILFLFFKSINVLVIAKTYVWTEA